MKHGGQWSCVDAILNKMAGYRRVRFRATIATATKSRRSAAAFSI